MLKVTPQIRRARALAALLTVGALALAGCGSDNGSDTSATTASAGKLDVPHKTIGYIDVLKSGAFQKRMWEAFQAAVAPTGWKVKFVDANGDPQAGAQAVQTMIDQRVDAIIDSALDPRLIRPQLVAAQQAGIPVITITGQDEPIESVNRLLAGEYGEVEADLAQPLADQMAQDLKPGDEVAILTSNLLWAARPRDDVVKRTLEAAGIKVVANVDTALDQNEGRKKASDIITANPDLDAIVPVLDVWTAPALDAIKQANKQDQIKVYAFYADDINVPLARVNDNIVALTDGNVAAAAPIAIDQLLKHFVGGKPIERFPAEARYDYAVIPRDQLPPEGQSGPVSIDDVVKPYLDRWQQEYAK